MSDLWLWTLVIVNSAAVALALLLARMALRRIRLDRAHLAGLRSLVENRGQVPLPSKRRQYEEAARQARADNDAVSQLPVRSCSEHGEDLILWDFFERKVRGFYLDIGAHDGVRGSNSYFFESLGWTGVCVEANPELAKRAAAARPGSRVVHAACGDRSASGTITFHIGVGVDWADTRSALAPTPQEREQLRQHGVTFTAVEVPHIAAAEVVAGLPSLDFVSVDVEGAELGVLQGFDFERHRPSVLVVEDNTRGADSAVARYLAGVGYRKALCVSVNDFYVRFEERRPFVV